MKKKSNKLSTRQIVVIGILGAITVVLGMTPLGFVPIGPLNATTMHIPVLIAAFIEGPVVGAFVGLIFGLSSLFNAITRPTPISFVFYNPLISIAPRILLGLIAYVLFAAFKRIDGKRLKILGMVAWVAVIGFLIAGIIKNIGAEKMGAGFALNIAFLLLSLGLLYLLARSEAKSSAVVLASFLATVIHSAMVMTGIYIFFAERFVEAMGASQELVNTVIFGTIATSGVPEGIIATIVSTAVVSAWYAKK